MYIDIIDIITRRGQRDHTQLVCSTNYVRHVRAAGALLVANLKQSMNHTSPATTPQSEMKTPQPVLPLPLPTLSIALTTA